MYQQASAGLALGEVVGDRFRLDDELGAGGMGTVYAATDLQTGARIALKLMRPELLADERAVERFRREGAALAAVRHAAVVQVREIGELPGGSLYIAMELLEGETLSARLERAGRMTVEQLLPIVLGLCDGLTAAHEGGVIHRDIKPSNIHLPSAEVLENAERTHERAPVKLVDFGVARVASLTRMTSTGLAIGTVRYMAPEQLTGSAIDERVDVYSLGVVMFQALAGEHPFERVSGDDPVGAILVGRVTPLSSLRPDLSPAVTRVVHRAMARLATERFGSTRALSDAFRRAVLESSSGEPMPPMDPLGRAQLEQAPTRPAGRAARRALEERASHREPPSESEVRKKRPPRRRQYWLVLPLITGLCLVPTLGTAGFVGCGAWMVDLQADAALDTMRTAIGVNPELSVYSPALDRFEQLRDEDSVNLFAATAFNARVQHAMRNDQRLSVAEVAWVVEVVQDINDRGGEYTLSHYSEMTEAGRALPESN